MEILIITAVIITIIMTVLALFYYATFITNVVNGWDYKTKKDIIYGFIPFYHWYNDALDNYRNLD